MDGPEQITVDQALEELQARMLAAEEHAYNLGKQVCRLYLDGDLVNAMFIALAAKYHRTQFGPWMEKRLQGIYTHGVLAVH